MKVLADYHHHDLYESLAILFEDRFDADLFRPIGLDWFNEGYWNFERAWHGDKVARQYLEPWGSDEEGVGWSRRLDRSHNRTQYLLTLEQARDLRPDLVIASVAHNHEGLHRFAREVGAKFAIQLGNVRFSREDMAEDRWDLADFGLVSTLLPVPPAKPHVVYHQEFSLTDFRYEPPPRHDPFRVSSFVNCFAENRRGYARFKQTAERLDAFDWRVYGAYGSEPEDRFAAGNIGVCGDVAAAMRDSDVIWHAKQWSDGYGHVIHNAFAVGRPVFGFREYYSRQLAGPLWLDGITSIDIETRSDDEVARIIAHLQADEGAHVLMAEAAARRFREVVNFDDEARQIAELLAAVMP